MQFTLSTVPLLLLSMYLWHRSKGQILAVAMFMSIFQAASIVNIGLGGSEIGISPTYFLLLIGVAQKIIKRSAKSTQVGRPLRSTTYLLLAFTVYSTISAFVNPVIFRGVPINNPKFGFDLLPLEFKAGCLNQLVYLFILVSLYLVAAYKTTAAEFCKALDWYVVGTVFAAFVSVYQLLCLKTGLPFPFEFIHTNPTYGIFHAYEINGFPRMNSTFTEASAAGEAFMSGLTIVLWRILSGRVSVRNLALASAILIGLLLTISTSGYLCLVYIFAVSTWAYFRRIRTSSDSHAAKVLLAAPVIAMFLIALGSPTVHDSINSLSHTVVLDKQNSDSYRQRTQWNDDTYNTARLTHWLGAGYGVCRASSLVPTMLGNVGIPGCLLFGLAVLQLFTPLLKRSGVKTDTHGAVLFTLSALFLDHVIAAPELTVPLMWFLLAGASRMAAIRPSPGSRRSVYVPVRKPDNRYVERLLTLAAQ